MPTKRQIQTGLNRLTKLADWLEANVTEENFDLRSVISDKLEKIPTEQIKKRLRKHDCGSTACAMGYTPFVFPKLVAYIRYEPIFANPYNVITLKKQTSTINYTAIAIAIFFLSYDEATYLFFTGHTDPAELTLAGTIARIRRFVADRKENKCHSTPTT